jgi:hypothetical protein
MRALTLWQPWASCIVRGPKRIENRPWKPFACVTGKRIAIHAGKTWDPVGAEFCAERGFYLRRDEAPLLAIVGTAFVERWVAPRDADTLPEDQLQWFFGPFGWVLRDVRPLTKPIFCRGARGLWIISDPIVDELTREGHL